MPESKLSCKLAIVLWAMMLCLRPSMSMADAICKKDAVPLDYVITAELNSPQCDDGAKPLAMNAWEVAPARDGIAVCTLPDYKAMGAKVASLVPCGTARSAGCVPRLDGLPNAIVLRSPNSCANTTHLPQNFSVHCFPNEPKRPAPAPRPYGRWGYRVGVVSVPQCHVVQAALGTDDVPQPNAWLFRDEADSPADRPDSACAGWDSNLILRRFYNPYCPSSPGTSGSAEGLTGWIVMGRWIKVENDLVLTFCAGKKTPVVDRRQARGGTGDGIFAQPVAHDIAVFYDPICGGNPQTKNAYRLRWATIGWSDAP